MHIFNKVQDHLKLESVSFKHEQTASHYKTWHHKGKVAVILVECASGEGGCHKLS